MGSDMTKFGTSVSLLEHLSKLGIEMSVRAWTMSTEKGANVEGIKEFGHQLTFIESQSRRVHDMIKEEVNMTLVHYVKSTKEVP